MAMRLGVRDRDGHPTRHSPRCATREAVEYVTSTNGREPHQTSGQEAAGAERSHWLHVLPSASSNFAARMDIRKIT